MRRNVRGAVLAPVLALGAIVGRADAEPSTPRPHHAAPASLPVVSDPLAELERAQQALFTRIARSVVYIVQGEGMGSGFFVTHDGLILTNAHVVGDDVQVTVLLHDGRRVSGRVVERAAGEADLALVQIPAKKTPPLELAHSDSLKVGTWVASVGHGMGGAWAYTTGMVTNIYPRGAERPVFQTQIPLNPGNSGGPIVDRRGQVVGVVTAGIKEASSMNFAIRSSVAVKTLSRLARLHSLTVTAPAGTRVFLDGRFAGNGPRAVLDVKPGTYEVSAVIGGKMHVVRVTYPKTRSVRLGPASSSAK